MKSVVRFLSVLLSVAMLVGLLPGFAAALVVKDSGYTKIATLPNTYTATQGMAADDKYIYAFQSPQGDNTVAHFIRINISSGAKEVMKYTDDTSITNFVDLGHGNDMCAVIHDGVTYLYLTTMYHKSHSTYKTHSLWKFKVSGNTLKKVAYYDVVQGTTNRNFTGLTVLKQTDTSVTLLGALDANFYEIEIPHTQSSGTVSCTKAFTIDFSSSVSISGAPTYNYTNSSGTKMYLVQGMTHSNGKLYYLMTAGTSNTPRSKNYILVYDISDYPDNKGKRTAIASESIYMTSSTYNYFMELESCVIRNGVMYFGANAGTSGYYQAYDFVGKLNTKFAEPAQYTVTFCDEAGSTLETVKVKQGGTASYTGSTPTKVYDESNHYSFSGWLTASGAAASLSNIQADTKVYAGFTPTAHSYTEKVITQPSCSAEGSRSYTCTCGRSYTEPVAKTEHSPVLINVQEATCGQSGYTGDAVCSVCNELLAQGTSISPTVHTPVKDVGYAATCTTPGLSDGAHCSVCGKVLQSQQELPVTGHNAVTLEGKAPTCLNSGLSEGSQCADCGMILSAQEVLPRLGHSYVYTNNGQDHTGLCERCEKILTQSHSYVDGRCICGAVDALVDSSIKLNHTLNLASDISVNFAVAKTLLAEYDLSTLYLECSMDTYEGNEKRGTTTVKLLPVEQGSYYYFTLSGLTAVQMNDRLRSVLYGSKNGQSYASSVDEYSIADYAYSQLDKGNASLQLKSLCADLLRYGAAAQTYKNYRTDAPADGAMTQVHQSYLSDLNAVSFGSTNATLNDLDTPTVTWVGKSLNLESKVAMKYVFSTASYTGSLSDLSLRISYMDISGKTITATVTEPEEYNVSTRQYAFSFDGLLAAELRSVLSAQIYAGEQPVSVTLQYSPDTYGVGKTGNLAAVCKALLAYSDSAKSYFTAQ